MLTFFTDPYEDELLYSVIGRYHYYKDNVNFKDTLYEIFGKRTVIPSFEFGSNLKFMEKVLNDNYNSESIIYNNTLFPVYSAFLTKERRKKAIDLMKNGNISNLFFLLGISAGNICKKEEIYYCPVCSKNDIEKHGEPYIHRIHQVNGVYVCPKHGTELLKYKYLRKDFSRIEYILLKESELIFDDKPDKIEFFNHKLIISKGFDYLLKHKDEKLNRDYFFSKYRNILLKKGFITSGGSVRQNQLYDSFIDFYNCDFLKKLDSDIEIKNEYNWLKKISRNVNRSVHPLRHMLLMIFLSGGIKEFINEKEIYGLFVASPWPCLNKVSDHYKEKIIKEIKITRDSKSGKPVGTFKCDKCGFIYSRKGPDINEADRYKIGRIKDFGHKWKDKAIKFLELKKYSIREISRRMSCDPKTIMKLHEMNLREENEKLKDKKSKDLSKLKVRVESKKYNGSLNPKKLKKIKKRIDWKERDIILFKQIYREYRRILRQNKPMRISKGMLMRRVGISTSISNNIYKLPKTRKLLINITESVESFQKRRIMNLILKSKKENRRLKIWEIQKLAGLNKRYFENLKNFIKENLEKYD